MKKWALLAGAVLLFSCGNQTFDFQPPVSMTITVAVSKDDPLAGALGEFSRLAAERSHGTLTVKPIFVQTNAAAPLLMADLQAGRLDAACLNALELGDRAEGWQALVLPFICRDNARFGRIIDGDIGLDLLRSLDREGVVGIGLFDSGALQVWSRQRALVTPADFAGVKFRVPRSRPLRRYLESLGAFVVPMPAGQIAAALKTGLIDGAAESLSADDAGDNTPLAPHVTLLAIARQPSVLVMSAAVVKKMPAGAIDFLRGAARDASLKALESITVREDGIVHSLKSRGVAVAGIENELDFIVPTLVLYQGQTPAVKKVIDRIQAVK